MKAIILAGGSGTRLNPITYAISKQIIPIYDKPMVYYPLSTVMNLGIKEILIISTPDDIGNIEKLLGNGRELGINISYKIQEKPRGIADSFIVGADFIGDSSVCLILGDNIFYGSDISEKSLGKEFEEAINLKDGACITIHRVSDPERYGVVEFDENGKLINIIEKPKNPPSQWIATGLYFYDNKVVEIAKNLKPSARGELEITDVNNMYLKQGNLKTIRMGRGSAWLDAGTPESLMAASQFVYNVEKRQGVKIACIEEIAYYKNFINKNQLIDLASKFSSSNEYGKYLHNLIKELN